MSRLKERALPPDVEAVLRRENMWWRVRHGKAADDEVAVARLLFTSARVRGDTDMAVVFQELLRKGGYLERS